MKQLLKFAERRSCTRELRIDFCKRDVEHKGSLFFTETKFLEMLEAAEYKQTNVLFSCLGVFVSVCFVNTERLRELKIFHCMLPTLSVKSLRRRQTHTDGAKVVRPTGSH